MTVPYIPKQEITKGQPATPAMGRWMDLVTPGTPGSGAVTDVTATAPIVSSGGTTPNISHANSGVTAATYGDATHVAQVAINGTGHITSASNVAISGVIQGAPVTITNATIKALPTTQNIQLVAAVAAMRIVPIQLDLRIDTTHGAYTNVDADGYWTGAISDELITTNFLANVSTIPRTLLTAFLTGVNVQQLSLVPYTTAEPVNDWGNLGVSFVLTGAGGINKSLILFIENNGAGDYGGGGTGNTLTITPWYALVSS